MSNFKRKLRRKQEKDANDQLKAHVSLFSKMGGDCAACEKPFDKKSREHASTWKVVVRKEEAVVRLYCPDCWGMARKLIEQVEEINDN